MLKGIRLFNYKTRGKLETEHSNKVRELTDSQFSYGLTKTEALVLNGSSIYILHIISIVLVVYLYINSQITVGEAIVSMGYVEVFINPIQTLMGSINALNASKDVRKKYNELIKMAKNDEILDVFDNINGSIELDGVNVEFNTFKLKNFSYTFEKGKNML